jgi:hypothetical protein
LLLCGSNGKGKVNRQPAQSHFHELGFFIPNMPHIYQGPEREGYAPGEEYTLMTQNFTGRRYFDLNDKEGAKDNRIMIWKQGRTPDMIVMNDQLDFEVNFKRS